MKHQKINTKIKRIFFLSSILALTVCIFGTAYAINIKNEGYRAIKNVGLTITDYNPCEIVTDAGTSDVFVPTNSLNEWSTFVSKKPSYVSLSPCQKPCNWVGFDKSAPAPYNASPYNFLIGVTNVDVSGFIFAGPDSYPAKDGSITIGYCKNNVIIATAKVTDWVRTIGDCNFEPNYPGGRASVPQCSPDGNPVVVTNGVSAFDVDSNSNARTVLVGLAESGSKCHESGLVELHACLEKPANQYVPAAEYIYQNIPMTVTYTAATGSRFGGAGKPAYYTLTLSGATGGYGGGSVNYTPPSPSTSGGFGVPLSLGGCDQAKQLVTNYCGNTPTYWSCSAASKSSSYKGGTTYNPGFYGYSCK